VILYEGSVKNLHDAGVGRLEFEYTDAYSVFDWGRMPDALPKKGESLAALGAWFFEQAGNPKTWQRLLSAKVDQTFQSVGRTAVAARVRSELEELASLGLAHHYVKRSAPDRILVEKAHVWHPKEHAIEEGERLYHYTGLKTDDTAPTFVPLEVVFRFGIPRGSSLLERLTPAYARTLGLNELPKEGARFEAPIVEFFSKLEDTDRFLSVEQALHYSGLSFEAFEKLYVRTLVAALWLKDAFAKVNLELWDGKLEWAMQKRGEKNIPVLVDSIGPDELRLLSANGTQISKEFLRTFYRKTKWYSTVCSAKQGPSKLDWKKNVLAEAGEPPRLDSKYFEAASRLYPSLALALTGENPGGLGLPIRNALELLEGVS